MFRPMYARLKILILGSRLWASIDQNTRAAEKLNAAIKDTLGKP